MKNPYELDGHSSEGFSKAAVRATSTHHSIQGVFLQMYQSSYHHAAPRAGGSEVDHGWITGLATGAHNTDPHMTNHVDHLQGIC